VLRAAAGAAAVTVALLLGAAACGGGSGGGEKTVTVGGDRLTVARLQGAAAGLCAAKAVAPSDPVAARADFYNQSHDALHSVARGLETVDRALAADLLVSMQTVEADLETKPPTLAADLGQLADVFHAGLARLAIKASPCVE
jgi:hypothetical protein